MRTHHDPPFPCPVTPLLAIVRCSVSWLSGTGRLEGPLELSVRSAGYDFASSATEWITQATRTL